MLGLFLAIYACAFHLSLDGRPIFPQSILPE